MSIKERIGAVGRSARVTLDKIEAVLRKPFDAFDESFHRAMGHSKLGNKWYDFYDPNVRVLKDGQVIPRNNRLRGW